MPLRKGTSKRTLSYILAGTIAAMATMGTTAIATVALSIASPEAWKPEAITGNINVAYTGNGLIEDATASTPTLNGNAYPYNKSKATLTRHSESVSVLDSHIVWGISTRNAADVAPADYSQLIVNTPNSNQYNIEADNSFILPTGDGFQSHYFIARTAHLPISSGEYSVSLPQLSVNDSPVVSAGWLLVAVEQVPSAVRSTFTPFWLGAEMNSDSPASPDNDSVVFFLDPTLDDLSSIVFNAPQSREPNGGFTHVDDLSLGDKDTSAMFIGPYTGTSSYETGKIPYFYSLSSEAGEGLNGAISILQSDTREPLSELSRGAKITVRVDVSNESNVDYYNSEVKLALPAFIQYKKGSLQSPPGTINSAIFTDREDEDPAHILNGERTIIWKPGNTAVSNRSRPYLIKPEDSSQILEFQAYIGDVPNDSVLRLNAQISSSRNSSTRMLNTIGTVNPLPVEQSTGSLAKTDLSLSSTLIPVSATYWVLSVNVQNISPINAAYEWSMPLPEGVTILEPEAGESGCNIARLQANENLLFCKAESAVLSGGLKNHTIPMRLLKNPLEVEWNEILLKTDSGLEEINMGNNETVPVMALDTFVLAPMAHPDSLVSGTVGTYESDRSILKNDLYTTANPDIQVTSPPIFGKVNIDARGFVEYAQRTRNIIDEDSFEYTITDPISGLTSAPVRVIISFPMPKTDSE